MNRWILVAGMWVLSGGGLQDPAEHAPNWIPYSRRPVPSAAVTKGNLSFDGRATAGDFTGGTSTVRGELTGGNDLRDVHGWVEAPVATLVTGNRKRDTDLNKSMESERYPTIRFELTRVTPRTEQGDTVLVDLQGNFQIHGVERAVSVPATVVLGAGTTRVRGVTAMNLKDYRIGGLTKAWGMLRMYEGIGVHFDLTFTPGSSASSGSALEASR